MASESVALNDRERLLIMAALLRGTPAEGPVRANCSKVLCQALVWAGLWTEEMKRDMHRCENLIVREWYAILISMTQSTSDVEILIVGYGNLGYPAAPSFTACGLTDRGREVAAHLFAEHPEYYGHPEEFFAWL